MTVDKLEEWRSVLISTKDYAYKNREAIIQSDNSVTKIPIPDDQVICNSCNTNIYPENGWLMEYKDEDKWFTYDIYCFKCRDEYFPNSEKCVLDTWMEK